MKVIHNNPTRIQRVQVDGNGAAVVRGQLLMPGVTAENNRSVFIRATSAAADALGVFAGDFVTTTDDAAPDTGLVYGLHDVDPILPGDLVAAEMGNDADNDVDVASATATVITITSLEDDIDGSWMYVRAGTGVGELSFITASASGNFTRKNATGLTTLDSTSRVLIMRKVAHQTEELSATTLPGQNIASTAAAGNLPWRVLRNEIKFSHGGGWEPLSYVDHHGLTGLNLTGFALRQILVPANTFFNPTD